MNGFHELAQAAKQALKALIRFRVALEKAKANRRVRHIGNRKPLKSSRSSNNLCKTNPTPYLRSINKD